MLRLDIVEHWERHPVKQAGAVHILGGQQRLASAARGHWRQGSEVMVEAKGKEQAPAPMSVEIV